MKLDELQALHEKARPVPWEWRSEYPKAWDANRHMYPYVGNEQVFGVWTSSADDAGLDIRDEDAALILALRNATPALLRLWNAATAIDAIYEGSFQGKAILKNVMNDLSRALNGPRFEELRAALRRLEEA